MAQDIRVALTLDNKQFNSAIKQSEKQVDKFGKQSTTIVSGLGKAFVALGLGSLIVDIGKTASRFQDLQNSLNVVFGSVEEGAVQFQRVKTFAAETQFSVETLTSAFTQLKGAGIEPTNELLLTFADTASVVVDQMGAFQSMIDLVTRSTGGGLGLIELERLQNRSIPVYEILSEKLGLQRKQLSAYGQSAEGARKIVEALTEGLQERFGGALDASSGNLSRATNNLGDAFDNLKVSLFGAFGGDTAGLINKLTDAINKLADNTAGIAQFGKVILGLGIAFASFKGLGVIKSLLNSMSKSFIASSVAAAKTGGVFAAFAKSIRSFGTALSGGSGKIITGFTKGMKKSTGTLSVFGKVMLRAKQIVFSFTAVFAALPRLLLRLAGPAGIIYAVVQAIDLLSQAFFNGFSPIQKFKDGLYAIWKILTPWKDEAREAAKATVELQESIRSAAVVATEARAALRAFVVSLNIGDSLKKAQEYFENFSTGKYNTELENAQKRVTDATKVISDLEAGLVELTNSGLAGAEGEIENFTSLLTASNAELNEATIAVKRLTNTNLDEFYQNLRNDVLLADNAQIRLDDTLNRLIADVDAGTLTFEQHQTALSILGQEYVNVADRVRDANTTFTDFTKTVTRQLADLQAATDQVGMTAFEKSQADIKRNLELLRTETIADLEKSMKGLAPNSQAYIDIEEKIKKVNAEIANQIILQTAAGQTGYEASRLFENGWDEALKLFIEQSTDGAAKAKAVFDTFTKGVEDAFVNFAKTGKLSFKDLLDSMVEMLLRSQIQKLMGTLLSSTAGTGIGDFFSKIFGRAQGGPVAGGTPYVVGEKGPEIFVPNNSGRIVPNGQSGGSVINNNTYVTNSISAVDAKSVAQLFAENRKTLLGTVQMAQNEMPYG